MVFCNGKKCRETAPLDAAVNLARMSLVDIWIAQDIYGVWWKFYGKPERSLLGWGNTTDNLGRLFGYVSDPTYWQISLLELKHKEVVDRLKFFREVQELSGWKYTT